MSYYEEIYQKRLNRYGLDYQSRVQQQREMNFESYLLRTPTRVDFTYNSTSYGASLERYKQDVSETQAYLLTQKSLSLPIGTILDIVSSDDTSKKWMVWWLEQIESSGYNRYIVLRVATSISWTVDSTTYSQNFYFKGPGATSITDTIKSSSGNSVYLENNNNYLIISQINTHLDKQQYFELTNSNITNGYVVKDVDITSTPGVGYYTLDPVPLRSAIAAPTQTATDSAEDFYWLNGGLNGST